MKIRIDKLLVEKGISPSRERAQALIIAGKVLVSEQKITKPGTAVDPEMPIRIIGKDQKYVSRAGYKLEAALDYWDISLRGASCMDIGSSTGGFTDCMLQRHAACVVAVDTGYGQMNARVRADPRVILLERTNARYLTSEDLYGPTPVRPVHFIAFDVSFISVTLLLPAVITAAFRGQSSANNTAVVLIKPQFEVGRQRVGKGGIVKDPEAHIFAIERVSSAVRNIGGKGIEVIESPLLGTEGNKEFLLRAGF